MLEIVCDRGPRLAADVEPHCVEARLVGDSSPRRRRLAQRGEPSSHINILRRAKLRTHRQKRRWRR